MKWLFLVHQVQTTQSRARVKIWRLTRKVGALLYRNSVYVLPHGKERLEDFQWLGQQIRDAGGEASVYIADSTDPREDRALRALLLQRAEEEYAALQEAAGTLRRRITLASEGRTISQTAARALAREVRQLHETQTAIERMDYFSSPIGDKTRAMLAHVARILTVTEAHAAAQQPLPVYAPEDFRGSTWTTRRKIHIDRLCSAWLIRRFIDPEARFIFAPESRLPPDAIPFDTFGAEFSHHGDACTFETLLRAFRLHDAGLRSLAEIVHDIDMKDQKFGRPEAPGLDAIVRALSGASQDDHQTLKSGSVILDALYHSLSGPRAKSRTKKK